jgi:hypothetical protein
MALTLKMIMGILLAAVLVIIIYVVIAVGFILDFCHWSPKRITYDGFRWKYNELEEMRLGKDPQYDFIMSHENRRKHYDINHYLIMSFYVRRAGISQEAEFAAWPFGVRSYYGYAHPPGE